MSNLLIGAQIYVKIFMALHCLRTSFPRISYFHLFSPFCSILVFHPHSRLIYSHMHEIQEAWAPTLIA